MLLADSTAQLLSDHDVLVEVSAHPVLAPALWQSVEESGAAATVLTTMRRGQDDRAGLIEALGALERLGLTVGVPSRRARSAELG